MALRLAGGFSILGRGNKSITSSVHSGRRDMRASRVVGALAGTVAALILASPAGASVSAPTLVTGASPFAVGCAGPGHDLTGTLFEQGEVEPWVAVDPANPQNVAGAWQQDRWSNGGSHGLAASASTDGGATWDG